MKYRISPVWIISFSQWLVILGWFNFSSLLPLIQRDLLLTSFQAGMVLSSFQFGYLLSVILVGRLTDRVKPRHIFIVFALITGTAGIMFAQLANSYWTAISLRFLVGFGLGGIYVPGLKYLSGLYPSRERGKVFGIFVGSLVIGSGSSFFIAAPLTALFNWREIILFTSCTAFVGAFMMFVYRLDPEPKKNAARSFFQSFSMIRNNKKLIQMNAAYMGHMWELYAFWGWIGPFMAFR
ncbi:nitrate/nitrite transporter [Cohnella sp.]|uniref:MFS transporter n=1 Tax=Cohnella sp. TaxID=1883426 RepID=UPI0035635A74